MTNSETIFELNNLIGTANFGASCFHDAADSAVLASNKELFADYHRL